MRKTHVRHAFSLTPLLVAALVSCTAVDSGGPLRPAPPTRSAPAATPSDAEPDPSAGQDDGAPQPPPSPGPELVRDAFAGLQATLNDTCTPGAGDCAYFLGRVHEELTGLDEAMKADPKGPGHFPEPIEWIAELGTTLNGDTSTENLETHRTDLIGVRDRINTWMQDHPDDYR
ncbi:hypothetical protein [Streptomyces sp. NPDC060194]|uniref:hypothetical protein n=1 Tax=Streptomyces sp. NPDC060194 TaxID=3347069 RepID=UPI00364AF717